MSQKQRKDNCSEGKLRILRELLENDELPAKERIDDALTFLKKQSADHKSQKSAQKHDIDKELDPKYQLILDHSPLAVLHFNKEGIITHCNNQLVELLGSNQEALLGLDMTELPDQQLVKALRNAQSGNTGHYRGHYKSVTSGKVIPVHGIFIPLREKGGSPAGGIAIIEDVTERIESQKQLRKFRLGIDRSPNPVFTTDTDGHIQYTNAAFEKLYGYTSKEVIGKNPRILKSGKQTEEFYKDFWRTITTGNVSRGEMINKTADGEYV
ncbi:MAG: PAS domain-containing protein, partial [Balneolaceae bacterium]|nr:PAS domain-containing protein [Balneolaceae bacterium]